MRTADVLVEGLRDLVREIAREEIAVVTVQPKPEREWLTVAEAADYLRVSSRTMERLIQRGEVRSASVERRRIVRKNWLDEYATAREGVAPTTPPRRRDRREYAVPTTP